VTLLASPCCKADLAALACTRCGQTYPSHGGVPVLLDEATRASAAHERFDAKYRGDDPDPWGYLDSAAEAMKYEFMVETISQLLPGRDAPVADIGCAQGLLAARLPELSTRAVAIDLSVHAVARLKGRLEVAAASALALPFYERSMQVLVLSDGLVSWGLDPQQRVAAVREAARALAPGGRAVFVEYLNPKRHHELTDAVRGGGLEIDRVHYLDDRLWYVTESMFRSLSGTRPYLAVARSRGWARALKGVSKLLGPKGSKHLCVVGRAG